VVPDLLVDCTITDPDRYNFYLQSHQAIMDTARSAHNHVLVDDIGFGKNRMVGNLPDLTHQLCYAFGGTTRGVSYVAPAYIAGMYLPYFLSYNPLIMKY
jgi:eukaryotic translation initiation factor 2C